MNEQGTQPIRFLTLCDLDQDGGKERILRFSAEGGPYLLLFRKGEAFYGTERTRAFQDLQTDGVYAASNGAMDSGYARLRLRGGRFYEETLAHRQSGGSKESETFSIGGRPATEAAVLAWEKAALVGGGAGPLFRQNKRLFGLLFAFYTDCLFFSGAKRPTDKPRAAP